MKTVKELTEELEVLYQHVATENSNNLSTIEEDLPGHPDDSTHDAGDGGNNGSDDNSGREQRKKKLSVPLWVGLGFSGLLIVAACVFFLTPLLHDKDPSQDELHVLPVKTFRAPITAITEGHTSPETTEAIKKPDTALNATPSEKEIETSEEVTSDKITPPEKEIETSEEVPSDEITPLENVKVAEPEKIQPLPDLSEEKPYTIQIIAFKTRRPAEALAKKFIGEGFDAHWEKVALSGGNVWYRTFIGHFSSREDAHVFKESLAAGGFSKECFIRKLK